MSALQVIKEVFSARKTLALALLVSLSLHLVFIGQIQWGSWFGELEHTSIIKTRLVPSSPAPKPTPSVKEPAPKKPAEHKPEPKTEPKPEPASNDNAVAEPPTETAAPPVAEEVVPIEPNELAGEPAVLAEDVSDEALAGNPYQQVVTEFAIYLNGESQKSGRSTITYKNDYNQRYSLTWSVEATGLLGLFYPNLVQTSEGNITKNGLQPLRYQYQFGDKKDKSYQAEFDWDNRTLMLKSSNGDKATDMASNTQDMLSFMYQFMFVAPLQEMRMSLTNGKRMNEYDYVFEGEETVTVDAQSLRTLHIAHSKANNDEKTELWLAVDYRYIPVKIKKTDKKGMVIEQVATHIATQTITPTNLP